MENLHKVFINKQLADLLLRQPCITVAPTKPAELPNKGQRP
jgi:hypothetical protein